MYFDLGGVDCFKISNNGRLICICVLFFSVLTKARMTIKNKNVDFTSYRIWTPFHKSNQLGDLKHM